MKLKFEDIKKEIENEGWTLLSNSYVNLKSDLEIECPNGHLNVISLDYWRRHKKDCPICKQNPYSNLNLKSVSYSKEKNTFRILAFDQASITSGWSVFDEEKLVSYGKWSSQGQHSTQRISLTKGWVASLIEKWKPNLVVFEDIQLQKFGENGQEGVLTYKKLAALQGVLKNYCYEIGIAYEVIPVATWRSFSEIKGKARTDRKKNAQLKIKKLYDVNVSQDEADSILIGRYAAAQHQNHKIIKFM